MVLDRDLGAEERVGVRGRVAARIDRHFGEVVGRGAVHGHVTPRRQGEHLRRGHEPERQRVAERCRELALDTGERSAVTLLPLADGTHHGDVLGDAVGDGHRRVDERAAHTGAATTPDHRRVTNPGCTECHLQHRRVRGVVGVRGEPVDLLRVDPGVAAGVMDRLEREPERALVLECAALPVCGAADADDAGLVTQQVVMAHASLRNVASAKRVASATAFSRPSGLVPRSLSVISPEQR
jgi:hypothetical protein